MRFSLIVVALVVLLPVTAVFLDLLLFLLLKLVPVGFLVGLLKSDLHFLSSPHFISPPPTPAATPSVSISAIPYSSSGTKIHPRSSLYPDSNYQYPTTPNYPLYPLH